MFVQKFMWILGFLLIFSIVYFIGKVVINKFFPKTTKELSKEKLRKEITKNETLKAKLETKRIQASLKEDELKLEKEIKETDKKIDSLKSKLNNL